MELEFVEFEGEKICFFVQRKKIKNMNLRVHRDKSVTLSIPIKMPIEKAKVFVSSKADWIKKQQEFYDTSSKQRENENLENGGIVYLKGEPYKVKLFRSNKNYIEIMDKFVEIHIKEKYMDNKEYIRKTYNTWLKNYAMEVFTAEILKYQQQMRAYGIPMPEVEIKQMKSTWGLCIPKRNKVKFSLNLIKTPNSCIEYVVIHELSHFKHLNHSKNFYHFVSIFMPDWKERKKRLEGEIY